MLSVAPFNSTSRVISKITVQVDCIFVCSIVVAAACVVHLLSNFSVKVTCFGMSYVELKFMKYFLFSVMLFILPHFFVRAVAAKRQQCLCLWYKKKINNNK